MRTAAGARGSLVAPADPEAIRAAIASLDFLNTQVEAESPLQRRASSRVYFVRYGTDGPIKIGTARDVRTRIASLQTGTPTELTYLGDIDGGVSAERALHSQFAHLRVVREWFAATPELLAFIDEVLPAA